MAHVARRYVTFLSSICSPLLPCLALTADPRIRIGAPIISIPPERLAGILTRRDTVPPPDDPDNVVPQAVRHVFEERARPGAYRGKKILSVHGGADETIPVRKGSEEFARIVAEADSPGDLVVFVQDGFGHVVTPEMVRRVAEWFWRWGCSEEWRAKL